MAIRELSYVLHRDPDTGADRLTPVTEVPDGVPDALLERVIAATHRGTPALSHTRLPHREGGALLCSARHDEESAGLRVDARYAPHDDWPRWPVDSWRPRALAPGTDGFAPADRLWDEALLAKFAVEQGPRIAPFLADVRRLFGDPAGRQIVLAEDDQETVARWIALACASLPVPLARALTFTTDTGDPADTPHQIVGVGPDVDAAVFDRFDQVTRTHLFRVHDGLGGPGSPVAPDPWADITAWLWSVRSFPRPAERPDDAFDLLPLARRALAVTDWTGLGADPLNAVLAAAARAADDPATDAETLDDITGICARVGARADVDAQPLAGALLRRRLRAAGATERDAALAAAVDLPLTAETRRAVRAEFGPSPEDELRGLLGRAPGPSWLKPLRTLLAAGPDRSTVVDEAVAPLADALARPEDRRGCADAVALLDALGDRAYTRRVIARLTQGGGDRPLQALRALAASPQSDWLRGHLDDAALPVRLAVSAGRLSRDAYGIRGAELWVDLARTHLDGKVPDVQTARLLWALVWPVKGSGPSSREQSRLTQVCEPRLLVDAGFGSALTSWLRTPAEADRRYLAFVRAMLDRTDHRISEPDRYLAQLIVLLVDFAGRRESLANVQSRYRGLRERAGRLNETLKNAIDYWIACGLAHADPDELRRTGALHEVAVGRPGLIRYYGDAVRDAKEKGALDPALLRDPRQIAALFLVWQEPVKGARGDWHRLSDDLLFEVLGAVLPHLGERELSEIATRLAGTGDERLVRAWNQWRQRMG